MIGVSYELFWTLNPKSLAPFIKAFNLKQKYDDTIAWQHGNYIRMAIASAMNKSAKYPSKPLSDTSKPQSSEMTAQQIKAKMMATAERINSRFRKEE